MIEAAPASLADAFPLIRGGGVFLITVGAAMIFGASAMRLRYLALGAGALIGSVATALAAAPLAAPHGAPDGFQLASLAAAVVLEVLAIVLLGPVVARRGEPFKTAAILGIVGVHFLIMAPAFGPPIVALGVLSAANALLGATFPRYQLPAIWLLDGTLKLVAGAAMFCAHRVPTLG